MRRVLASILATGLTVAILGAAPVKSGSKAVETPTKPYQIGRASWYGKPFHGRTTANGETYNMFHFTAAHRQLPLGTWVKVTNLRNSKWVMVRVNDRGPVPESRIIDLSYAVAQLLEFRERGTERVRLDIVKPETIAATHHLAGLEEKPVN
ncbi:MAG TPA: septal ring lytic transglycosylase RlpA family protein [Terriglobales bacterium]|nr:septal ring lytic transglycosylase RlpA family protein [Terriglobales bacterium]